MSDTLPEAEREDRVRNLDKVLAAVGRHWQDACEHGDLLAAKRDMQRIDSYLEQRLRLTGRPD